MQLTTKGKGKVNKVEAGTVLTLSATPSGVGWSFKHFIVDGLIHEANPLVLSIPNEIKEVVTHFCVTIEDYLLGKVGFDVEEIALNSIRIDRNVDEGEDVNDVSAKDRELLYADLMMWASTSPTSYAGKRVSDLGYSITEAGKTISVTDKKRFEKIAMEIYKNYGDPKYSSSVRIVNLW